MSERKSWDIQPKRRTSVPQELPPERAVQRPVGPVRPVRSTQQNIRRNIPQQIERRKEKPMPEPQARAIKRPPPVQQGRDREPLKARRRRARRRSITAFFIFLLVASAAALGSLWLPSVRIQHVVAAGPDSDGIQQITTSLLSGTVHYIIPKNSIFVFPQQEIRIAILKQFPEISAVSISRASFNTITIASIPREAAFTWCGDVYQSSATQTASSTCYSADAEGVIFAPISTQLTAADTSSAQNLRIFAPLSGSAETNSSPLGARIAQATLLPNALQFVKALKSLGVSIVTMVIRGDEADLYAQSGTRITYVLGHEEITSQVAASTFPTLNLTDGSLDYVDLRFEGKAYFKKTGSSQPIAATSTTTR